MTQQIPQGLVPVDYFNPHRDGGRDVMTIQAYSLSEYVATIVKAVGEGYTLDYSNEAYPQGFSGNYRVGMSRVATPVVEDVVEEVEAITEAVVEEAVKKQTARQVSASQRNKK